MRFVESHGQSPCLHAEVRFGTQAWRLTNGRAGRHPGQKLAHSSTAKGRGFLLPGQNVKNFMVYYSDVPANFSELLIHLQISSIVAGLNRAGLNRMKRRVPFHGQREGHFLHTGRSGHDSLALF